MSDVCCAAMARLRQARPSVGARQRMVDYRRIEADPTQLAIGVILVVIALVGLVYTFSA
jgi:hypothetical protein